MAKALEREEGLMKVKNNTIMITEFFNQSKTQSGGVLT
jgi:hypothetical protein